MTRKVVINPKTGMAETVNDYTTVTAEDVARTRKQLRDMLSGNTPFHEDEFAEKKDEKPVDEQTEYQYDGYFGFAGIHP